MPICDMTGWLDTIANKYLKKYSYKVTKAYMYLRIAKRGFWIVQVHIAIIYSTHVEGWAFGTPPSDKSTKTL